MAAPLERTVVRVVLIDEHDRVLLLGAKDPGDGKTVWMCPGGAIERDESDEAAALRELEEEIGFSGDLSLDGPVWTRRHRFTWDGREILQFETFYVTRFHGTLDPTMIHPQDEENDYFVGARWLTADEIGAWPDIVAPTKLPELIPPLLRGNVPTSPADVGI